MRFLFQRGLFPFQTHNHRLMFPLYRIATHEHFVWLGHSAGSELPGYVDLLVALYLSVQRRFNYEKTVEVLVSMGISSHELYSMRI